VSVIPGWFDCFVCIYQITLGIIGQHLDPKGVLKILLTLSTVAKVRATGKGP